MGPPSSPKKPNLPSASALLESESFKSFPEFAWDAALSIEGHPRDWFERRLEEGKPFVVRGFQQSPYWAEAALNTNSLKDLLKGQEVDVHHCSHGRTAKASFSHFIEQCETQRNNPLYARDIDCPLQWQSSIESIVSKRLWHLGPGDLARCLPKVAQSDVVMVHVGTTGSFTGFHWADCGGVSLSLLTESEGRGPGSIWFATDRQSSAKYDRFLESLRKSPHTNWDLLTPEQLRQADFPVYVAEQNPGDLVVFPSGAPHQVVNLGRRVTTVAWNILHSSSIRMFNDYLEPRYNQVCHGDIGRMTMVPRYTLQAACDGVFGLDDAHNRRDVEQMLDIFATMYYDERLPSGVSVETELSDFIITCSFCDSVIWNRHLHCAKCPDFDLCLRCFIAGRSCKNHYAEYSLKQLVSSEDCENLIKAIEVRLGRSTRSEKPSVSLGALAAKAIQDRRRSQPILKGCHMCLCKHEEGATMQCTKCAKFFCLRNFVRHFEIDLISFLRERHNQQSWECPWCTQTCSCSHCDFPQAYQSTGKYLTYRGKIPQGLKLGVTDVVNPLGPKAKRPAMNGEPSESASKRLRLNGPSLDNADPKSLNQGLSRPTRRVDGGANRQAGRRVDSELSSDASSSGEGYNDGIDYTSSDSSDEYNSRDSEYEGSRAIKSEPSSSPAPTSQRAEHALDANPPLHTPQAGPHRPGALAVNSARVSGPSSRARPMPRDTEPRGRPSSLNRPSPLHAEVTQQPTPVMDQHSRRSTSYAQRPSSGLGITTKQNAITASQDSSSRNRATAANTEARPHQSTANALSSSSVLPRLHPDTRPNPGGLSSASPCPAPPSVRPAATAMETPPDQASMSPMTGQSGNSLTAKKAKLDWLRGCSNIALKHDDVSLYEMLRAEIDETQMAIDEDQVEIKHWFQNSQGFQIPAEMSAKFQKYLE